MDSLRKIPAVYIGLEILANFVLPYLIFLKTAPILGQVHALLAASSPPILWSGFEFVRKRRVDAMSIFVLVGIALSLLAFLGGGSVRFLQLRESLVAGLIGLTFLGSAAVGRPLMDQLARASMLRKSRAEAEELEGLRNNRNFRRVMTTMTLVWGFGLVVKTAIACLLVFSLSIQKFLVVGPILGYGTIGCLFLWTFWYGNRMKRRGEAARAASQIS